MLQVVQSPSSCNETSETTVVTEHALKSAALQQGQQKRHQSNQLTAARRSQTVRGITHLSREEAVDMPPR